MSDIEVTMVPKDLYYHEVAYVRGLEKKNAELVAALKGLVNRLDEIHAELQERVAELQAEAGYTDAIAAVRNAELVAALELSRPFVRIAATQKQADASSRWYDKAMTALAAIDAALAAAGHKP